MLGLDLLKYTLTVKIGQLITSKHQTSVVTRDGMVSTVLMVSTINAKTVSNYTKIKYWTLNYTIKRK